MWCIRVTLHCRLLGDLLEVVEEIGSDGVSQSVEYRRDFSNAN